MKIAHRHLSRFTAVPSDAQELRLLLDDLGVEVKRHEHTDQGAIFTLELLANRGDHHSYAGIAREITGRTGGTLSLPDVTPLEVGPSPVPLRCETDLCLAYTATLLERTAPDKPLPHDVVFPIVSAGQGTVGPAVDATNLANLELGQPTHAFDADRIVGGITLRTSRPGETAWPLFTEGPVPLPEGTLVVADDEKILAIAGVIGCEDSKATPETRRLLLESATFDPVSVRKASRALGIHTDSSARFERGGDPLLPLVGAGRVVRILEDHGLFRRVGTTGVVGDYRVPDRVIPLDIPTAAGFLEHPLTADEAADRLGRYGFAVSGTGPDWDADDGWARPAALADTSRDRLRNTVLVRVPSWRLWDVEHTADLHEELAKSIGYNNTPEALPPVDMGAVPSARDARKSRVEDVLVGNGFYEVFTDGFYARAMRDLLGIGEGHPLWAHVETQNALDRGYSLLKNNAIGQAVEAVAQNVRMKNEHVRAYEWTRLFEPDPQADNGVCTERRVLWAVANAPGTHDDWSSDCPNLVWVLSGIVRELGVELGVPLTLGPADPEAPLYSTLHPHRQATVLLDGTPVGVLGEVHPGVVQRFKLKRVRPCFLQLDADRLLSAEPRRVPYVEPPQHHPVVRALAFTLPTGVRAGEVAEHLQKAGPAWLRRVDMVDLFAHEDDGAPVRTVTYELWYANDDAQRTADEVNAASEYLVRQVEQRFGDRGVRQRA